MQKKRIYAKYAVYISPNILCGLGKYIRMKPHRIYADLENISGYPKRICTYLPKTAYAESAWSALVSVLHFLNLVLKNLFLSLKKSIFFYFLWGVTNLGRFLPLS